MTPKGQILKGYKATDKDIQCLGYQFEVGKWHEHEGEIKLCESGFHYCEHPSGPWAFYRSPGTRIWEVEAELVEQEAGPGADIKHVAKRIKLVREIKPGGNRNTGDWNTGDRNTGNRNTGDRNTGNWNTGYGNTGYGNTGNRNTGYGNTGNWNTGYGNTGYGNTGGGNTGDRNTGYGNTGGGNTGDRNTGGGNTGDRNTGYGSVGDGHTGSLCMEKQPIRLFDRVVENEATIDWWLVEQLAREMKGDDDIDPAPFLSLPHATVKRIKKLHNAHKAARRSE